MIAIGSDDRVVFVQDGNRTDGDCFLAVVKMAETFDFAGEKTLLGFLFKVPNLHHLAEQLYFLRGLQFGQPGRRVRFRILNGRIGSGHIAEICLREAI